MAKLSMFAQFRSYYPTGSLIGELLQIHQDNYLVRVSVQVGGVILATGMAAASTIELAEDRARERAIAILGISPATPAPFPPLSDRTPNSQVLPELPASPSQARDEWQPSLIEQTPLPDPSIVGDRSYSPTPNTLTADPSLVSSGDRPEIWQSDSSNGMGSAYGDRQISEIPTSQKEEKWPVDPLENPVASEQPEEMGQAIDDEDMEEWSKLNANIDVERKLLGWTSKQEQFYLNQIYGKKSIPMLGNAEMKEYLEYLKTYRQTEIQRTERLHWGDEKCQEYLKQTYNRRSRAQLNLKELKEFLEYLQSQPTPNENLF